MPRRGAQRERARRSGQWRLQRLRAGDHTRRRSGLARSSARRARRSRELCPPRRQGIGIPTASFAGSPRRVDTSNPPNAPPRAPRSWATAIRRPLSPCGRVFAHRKRAAALARGKPVPSASRAGAHHVMRWSKRYSGSGQRIDSGRFGLGLHDVTGIDIASPGRRIAGRGQRRWAGRLAEVRQDCLDRGGVGHDRDDPHLARAVRTDQREGFMNARQQHGPQVTGLAARARVLRLVSSAAVDNASCAPVRPSVAASESCSDASAVTAGRNAAFGARTPQ